MNPPSIRPGAAVADAFLSGAGVSACLRLIERGSVAASDRLLERRGARPALAVAAMVALPPLAFAGLLVGRGRWRRGSAGIAAAVLGASAVFWNHAQWWHRSWTALGGGAGDPGLAPPRARPRTVLYVDYYPTIAGGQVVLLNTFKALDRSRYRPALALPAEGPFAAAARAAGVPVHIVPMRKARWRRPWEALPATLGLARVARSEGADLIEANCYPANKLAAPAARLVGVPCLWRKHVLARRRGSTTAALWRLYARLDARVVGVSDTVVRSLKDMGIPPDKLVRLYNGVDTAAIRSARVVPVRRARELGFPVGFPVVGVVAVRRAHKGLEVFLEACRRLARTHPRARFVLIGDPAHAEDLVEEGLRAAAGEEALAGRLRVFPGRPDVLEWMRRFTVLVSPSHWEVGAPLVVLEAMALGVPVVATRGSSGELIRDGVDGLLAPTGDAAALAEAVGRILDDPRLGDRLARAARASVEARHSLGRYARALEGLYDEVLAERGGRRRG